MQVISAMTGNPPFVPSDQEPVSMLTEKQNHPDFVKTRFCCSVAVCTEYEKFICCLLLTSHIATKLQ